MKPPRTTEQIANATTMAYALHKLLIEQAAIARLGHEKAAEGYDKAVNGAFRQLAADLGFTIAGEADGQ